MCRAKEPELRPPFWKFLVMQYIASSDWFVCTSREHPRGLFDAISTRSRSFKMATRILSRLNLVSKRFFSAAASQESSFVEKQLAESKHAACKSKD